MNMPIDLRHLRYFNVLAEELHFGRAAERLHMAQAPFSQQIRQLEERIGTDLFHRTTRKVQLSAAGLRFRDYAQKILLDVDEAVRYARSTSSEEAGRIRVGCINMVLSSILPGAIRKLRDIHPAVVVTPSTQTTGLQIDMLLDNKLDLALIRPSALPNYLRGEIIFREALCVAMPEDHPLAKASMVQPKQLENVNLMSFAAKLGTSYGPAVDRALKQAGVRPVLGEEFADTSSALCLVSAGIGVAILPTSTSIFQYPGVVYRPLNLDRVTADIMLVTRHGAVDRKTRDFIAAIREFSSHLEIVADGPSRL